jgi:hypothetical protein
MFRIIDRIKLRKIDIILLAGVLFIFLFIYKEWFSFNILKGGEWLFFYTESIIGKSFTGTWISDSSLGYFNNVIIYRFPVEILISLFGFLGFDSRISDFFIFRLPIIVGFPLAAYIAGKYFLKFNQAGTITLVFALSFNSYFLFINAAGHLHINVAAVAAIIAFLLYAIAWDKNKRNLLTASFFFLFLSGLYDFRPTYMAILMMFLYKTYISILDIKFKKRGLIFKSISIFKSYLSIFAVLFFILLSFSFWLIPAILSKSINNNVAVNSGLFGSQFFDIIQSITLHHPYWNGSEPISFIKNNPPYFFWFLPIFSFFGVYLHRKNRKIVFFAFIALLGIFLTKHSDIPFSNIYKWLYDHVLGFNAFRESSKFFFLIAIGYSISISSLSNWLWMKSTEKKVYLIVKYIFTLLVVCLFVYNTKPMITGEIKTMFLPRVIPNDYLILREHILREVDFSRILWIPTISNWSVFTNNHPKVSAVGDLDYYYNFSQDSLKKQLIAIFELNSTNYLLDNSSIKYIVVPIKDLGDDNPFYYYGNNRQFYIDRLDKTAYLKKINIGTDELTVYENKNFRPRIYSTIEKETILKNVPFSKLNYQFVNPAEYKVILPNISEPVYLNFSDTYHPDWKLRVGEFNWFQSLIQKDYYYPDKYHLESDIGLNHWKIDPKWFKDKGYQVGEIVPITLYFAPQAWMNLGLIISGSTFIIILGFLVYFTIKKYEKK